MISSLPNASRLCSKQILPSLSLAALACATAALLAQAPLQSQGSPQPPANQPPANQPTANSTPNRSPGGREAQPRTAQALNRNLIVLDPAHGGPETGAKLNDQSLEKNDQSLEKDVTLALASRLRATLAAAGFTVVFTRDADLAAVLTTDQRAELANRQHAAACLILHATSVGSGIHLFLSGLQPTPPSTELDPDIRPPFEPVPWQLAQTGSVTQSLHLQTELFSSLNNAGLSALRGRGPLRPLDNLLCPAIAIEVAPLGPAGGPRTPVTDAGYQQRLAEAVTSALGRWRDTLPARQRANPAPPAAIHPPVVGGPQ